MIPLPKRLSEDQSKQMHLTTDKLKSAYFDANVHLYNKFDRLISMPEFLQSVEKYALVNGENLVTDQDFRNVLELMQEDIRAEQRRERAEQEARELEERKKTHTHAAIAQAWWEHERGWGGRPDGYSLHSSDIKRKAFIENYWAGMPNATPDDYSAPEGDPFICLVDAETINKIESSEYGIWVHRGVEFLRPTQSELLALVRRD